MKLNPNMLALVTHYKLISRNDLNKVTKISWEQKRNNYKNTKVWQKIHR